MLINNLIKLSLIMLVFVWAENLHAATTDSPHTFPDDGPLLVSSNDTRTNTGVENYTVLFEVNSNANSSDLNVQANAELSYLGSDSSGGTLFSNGGGVILSDWFFVWYDDLSVSNSGVISAGNSNYAINFNNFIESGVYSLNFNNNVNAIINGDVLLTNSSMNIINSGTINGNVSIVQLYRDITVLSNGGTIVGDLIFNNFYGEIITLTGTATSTVNDINVSSGSTFTANLDVLESNDININSVSSVSFTIDGGGVSTINDFTLTTIASAATVTLNSGSTVSMNTYSASSVNNHSLFISNSSSLAVAGDMQGMRNITNSNNSSLIVTGDVGFNVGGTFTNAGTYSAARTTQTAGTTNTVNTGDITINGDYGLIGAFTSTAGTIEVANTATVSTSTFSLSDTNYVTTIGGEDDDYTILTLENAAFSMTNGNFSVNYIPAGARYLPEKEHLIISSAGTAVLSGVTYDLPAGTNMFLAGWEVIVGYKDVFIKLDRNNYDELAQSDLAVEIGAALERIGRSTELTENQFYVFNYLDSSDNVNELTSRLEQLTPINTGATEVLKASRVLNNIVHQRLSQLGQGDYYIAGGGPQDNRATWFKVIRRKINQEPYKNARGYDANSMDFILAFEDELLNTNPKGIALGFATTKLNEKVINTNEVDISSYQVAPYGSWSSKSYENLTYNWMAGITIGTYKYKVSDFTAKEYQFDRSDLLLSYKLWANFDFEFSNIHMQPQLIAQYTYAASLKYEYAYLPGLTQQVKPGNESILTVGLGADCYLPWVLSQQYITPKMYAYYLYDVAGGKQIFVSNFSLGSSYSGIIRHPKEYIELGFSLSVMIADIFELECAYDYSFQTKFRSNNFMFKFKYSF